MGGFAALLHDRDADRPEMGRVWQGPSPVPAATHHTAPGSSVHAVTAQGLFRVYTQALQGKPSPSVIAGVGVGGWPADATPRVSCFSAGLCFPPSSGLHAPRLRVSQGQPAQRTNLTSADGGGATALARWRGVKGGNQGSGSF